MARCIARKSSSHVFCHRVSHHRRGITLIEMLIAIAISLIVMLAVIQVFDQLNSAMANSKAAIEQAGELRNVTQRLQADLDGRTALTLAWSPADAGDGYTEYIEGTQTDLVGSSASPPTYWGDHDDILMLTSRSTGKPFVGRYDPDGAGPLPVQIIESELAEIIWWVRLLGDLDGSGTAGDNPREFAIYRRALLIRPDLNTSSGHLPGSASADVFFQTNDVSFRSEGGNLIANSLADLTLRENRAFHTVGTGPGGFPHALDLTKLVAISGTDAGIDLVLDKVAAFDVRVYDPMAPLRSGTNVALTPGDPGWAAANTTPVGRGAYVDLNYHGVATTSLFSGPANNVSRAATPHTLPYTYSTWPEAYEHDGVNQDGDVDASSNPIIDEGRDGFDSGGPAAADDPSETETFPPYPHAIAGQKFPGLRGMQVRIRLVESDSRQVRQATVVSDFVPE